MSETEQPPDQPVQMSPLPSARPAGGAKLVVPEWALRARVFLRKAIVVSAGATGIGYCCMFVAVFSGMRSGAWIFIAVPVGGIFLFCLLNVLLLVAGFVQYSLAHLLKITLFAAACMTVVVSGPHWIIKVIGGIGLLGIAVILFKAATRADTQQP